MPHLLRIINAFDSFKLKKKMEVKSQGNKISQAKINAKI